MEDLNAILSDAGSVPADEPEAVLAVEPEQHEAPAAQATGEVAAPPAETHKEDDTARGFQAALMAERGKRQAAEARVRQLEQPAPPAEAAAPDPAQYQDNPQEYWRLVARHEARQELASAIRQGQEQQAQAQERERLAETVDRLNAAVAIGQGKFKDFDAVINGGLAPYLNDSLREEIAASDHGPDVAYWLGKNPAEARRIAALPSRAQAREIVRLESKVAQLERPVLPSTLTDTRDSRGRFANADAYEGPTPLDAVLGRKS